MSDESPIRVTVSDDSDLFRGLLVQALRAAGFEVVGEASDFDHSIALIERHRPDVAVLDVRMPPTGTTEGIKVAQHVLSLPEPSSVLLLSQYVETATAADVLATGQGGVGYLLKERVGTVGELVSAIRRVHAKEVVLDPEVVRRLVGRRRTNDPLDSLTPTQLEVLGLVAEGWSNRGIADRLAVSERTVESHISTIFELLNLERVAEVHRRVLAAVSFLRSRSDAPWRG